MTRLKTEWIEHMKEGMAEYDRDLLKKTGVDLAGLVMHVYGIAEDEMEHLRKVTKVAAVPVTQGQGIIGSFSESVAAIVRSMGFEAEVSRATDVEGIFEAGCGGADVLFMADDERYLALNVRSGAVGENDYATALGYIAAAELMAGQRCGHKAPCSRRNSIETAGQADDFSVKAVDHNEGSVLAGQRVLLIGFGRVGKQAAEIMLEQGASFDLLEEDAQAIEDFEKFMKEAPEELKRQGGCSEEMSFRSFRSLKSFDGYDVVLDFTNKGDWITADMVRDDLIYASPGVPLSLTEEAEDVLKSNCIYDNLEIGTAIMLGEALCRKILSNKALAGDGEILPNKALAGDGEVLPNKALAGDGVVLWDDRT